MIQVSRYSVVYIKIPVKAVKNGVSYDPTSDAVAMAFTQGTATPTAVAASWEPGTQKARIQVGTGTAVGALAPGFWDIWVKITDSPEVPFEKVDLLEIY